MSDIKRIYLFILAAALMVLGWPPFPTGFLLFIGLVPLLMIYDQLQGSKRKHWKFLGWTYLVMFVFNTGSTWWVWNASISGCIMMLVLNSLIMSLPFVAFSITKSILPKTGYISLPVYYLAMEYIHFNWSASWPWMTLGKGLAGMPLLIQWYEFTGEMGGTLLILLLNIMVFKALKSRKLIALWRPVLFFTVVAGISLGLNARVAISEALYKPNNSLECIITQPNIDPYEEKFGEGDKAISPEDQLAYAIEVAKPLMTPETELILMPETAIVGWNNESKLGQLSIMQPLIQMTDSNNLKVLTGSETYKYYEVKNRPSITARFDSFSGVWFDCYNTALLFKQGRMDSLYHKSKLVPGVEKMPFAFLEQLSIDLGGTSGSLGISDRPVNFIVNDRVKMAPLICYESVFGDYACDFVRDGATALAVITNDGWWGNTPGYQQHLLFGAIRCIETRREMVRSANTGVSAHIDVRGRITQHTEYNERTAFRCTLRPNTYLTFYVKHGNLAGRIACLLTVVLISLVLAVRIFQKFSSVTNS